MTRAGLALVAALAVGLAGAACSGNGSGGLASQGRIETEGGPIAWFAVGEGPAYVVVHGGPGLDHRYLRPGMDVLAEDRQLVYYDQRGVGSSVPDSGDATGINWPGMLDDLGRLADRFAGEDGKIGLVAHSWGAKPALAWAIQNPDRVRALVLVSPVEPGGLYGAQNRRRQSERTNPRIQERLDSIMAAAPPGWRTDPVYRAKVWRTAFALVEPDPEVIDDLNFEVHPVTARRGDEVAEAVGSMARNLYLWDLLDGLDVPVLIVHGEEDVGTPRMAEALADSLPQGRAVILNGVGHFPWASVPDRFTETVDTFLARIEGR